MAWPKSASWRIHCLQHNETARPRCSKTGKYRLGKSWTASILFGDKSTWLKEDQAVGKCFSCSAFVCGQPNPFRISVVVGFQKRKVPKAVYAPTSKLVSSERPRRKAPTFCIDTIVTPSALSANALKSHCNHASGREEGGLRSRIRLFHKFVLRMGCITKLFGSAYQMCR